jgi:hypothetical protein
VSGSEAIKGAKITLYPRQELEPWAGMALIEGGRCLRASLLPLAYWLRVRNDI